MTEPAVEFEHEVAGRRVFVVFGRARREEFEFRREEWVRAVGGSGGEVVGGFGGIEVGWCCLLDEGRIELRPERHCEMCVEAVWSWLN